MTIRVTGRGVVRDACLLPDSQIRVARAVDQAERIVVIARTVVQ